MQTDSPPAQVTEPAAPKFRLLAPIWHTAILVAVLLVASLSGSRGHHAATNHHKLLQYAWGMTWEWLLFGFAWLGFRKRVKLRELIGGRWSSAEDFFMDVCIAGFFWFVSMIVLAVVAKAIRLDHGNLDAMRKELDFLVPRSRVELTVWFCLSSTAGFCEEVLFRGYLQLQCAALTGSMLLGAIISAIIFGASHGYEGPARMFLIGIYGLLFGLLAWWRKSLRPGMMAHAWHDALSGAVLRMLK